MSKFDDRKKEFETKFVHEETLQFKISARRNKLLGLWAADLMGMTEKDAEDYANQVVKADFEEVGEEDVYRKIKGDFDDKGITLSEHQIRREMKDQLSVARQQIMADVK